mmetsp:Transcript_490/g.692  ORF Transcript_490/g.692 Transcript_490/m.692 type:complete len:324 (-) Transcript_490:173-1144(-)
MECSSLSVIQFSQRFEEIKSICFDEESNTLWIADKNVIKRLRNHDLTTLSVSKTLSSCGMMLFDSRSKQLIVTQPFTNQVLIIETKTGLVESIGSGSFRINDGSYMEAGLVPYGITLDKNNNILLCDPRNLCIRFIDRQQKHVSTIIGHKNKLAAAGISPMNEFIEYTLAEPNLIWFDRSNNSAYLIDGVTFLRIDFTLNTITKIGSLSRWSFSFKDMLVWKGDMYILHSEGIFRTENTPTEVKLQQVFSFAPSKGFCIGPWGNVYTSVDMGRDLAVIYRKRAMGWKQVRVVWIGNLKEQRTDCVLATLPRDIMWHIIIMLLS